MFYDFYVTLIAQNQFRKFIERYGDKNKPLLW